MSEHPATYQALAGAVRAVGHRLTAAADLIEHGDRARHMEPGSLLRFGSPTLAAATALERELAILEGMVRSLAPLARAGARAETGEVHA